MRIIAGEWRGRHIRAPKGDSVRPTLDRVREAWMSIVHMTLPGARVADLFAGSGALGLEALSRGAEHVDFIENDPRTLRILQENVAALEAAERCTIHRADALTFIGAAAPYDIVFADPPYRKGIATELAERWLKTPFATIFGVEHESFETLPEGGDTRKYGDSSITIYRQ